MRPTSRLVGASLVGLFMIAPAADAQEPTRCAPPREAKGDLLSLGLEVLMNVNVTTASKRSETLSHAPGVVWSPYSYIGIKALYGRAFRAPSINETNLNHPGLAGNPDLVPEKVGTFDLGLTR